jgi:Mrp family chromosome partitioning ATPase
MIMISRIIPTTFIKWVQNLPEWFLFAAMGCFILLIVVIMWLVIRKLNSQTETESSTNTKAVSPKPPAAPPSKPAVQPASVPVPKPQPVPPMPSVPAPVSSLKPSSQPEPAPAAKPQPAVPLQSIPVPASESPLEPPSNPVSEHLQVFDPLIYKKIASLGGTNKSVLFAGAGLEHLPVTIPVQIAAKLAGAGKKILLIDLDMKRNAVAKVFDPNENMVKNCTQARPLPSPMENLSFWPAEFFVRFGQMNLRIVIQSASSKFDILLINAPYLDGHPDRKLIASCARYGLIFCKTKQQFERLQTLMAMGECQLLESKPIEC